MTRRERSPLLVLVVALGVGLLAAAYAVWALEAQVRTNQALIRQQQQTLSQLVGVAAGNTQELQEQRRLVQVLSRQVRQLGGTPATLAPTPTLPRPAPRSSGDAPTKKPSRAASSPSPTPGPTPRPTPSQSAPSVSPSPSPTCRVKAGPVCL